MRGCRDAAYESSITMLSRPRIEVIKQKLRHTTVYYPLSGNLPVHSFVCVVGGYIYGT